MNNVLFIPLNSNHVRIFFEIIKSLSHNYDLLCYDRICNEAHFYTESTLRSLGLSYKHFPKKIHRIPSDSMIKQILSFFKMRGEINKVLDELKPKLLVFAIDHDPIAQIFIKSAKKRDIKTILIQEALIRPYEYTYRPVYFKDYLYNILRFLGVYLNYVEYGRMGCDYILVGGQQPKSILARRGIPENKTFILGQPKYDDMIMKTKIKKPVHNQKKVYLFIASTKIISDEQNVRFLNKIIEVVGKLEINLIIKLHPRSSVTADHVYRVINNKERSFLTIIKEGDDTFEILKRSDVLITVSSTVILEALMMDKECLIANYMAGEGRLDYERYDAVFTINSENEISSVIKKSMIQKKTYRNKQRLLEDELYKLDGKSGERTSDFIDQIIRNDRK